MFIQGCIGDLCHLAVVECCYIFWGGWVVCSVGLACEKYLSVKSEYISFPTGLCGAYICAFFSYEKSILCSWAV